MYVRIFFFNDTATTEIYTLSLHDALPICRGVALPADRRGRGVRQGGRHPGRGPRPLRLVGDDAGADGGARRCGPRARERRTRSEEHTSELQSRQYLVCRLLLEKKKNNQII